MGINDDAIKDAPEFISALERTGMTTLKLEPVAWMRRWAFDGEVPKKERGRCGRMVWPKRFKLLPVTMFKCLPDDIPLFSVAPASDDSVALVTKAGEKMRERCSSICKSEATDAFDDSDAEEWARGAVMCSVLIGALPAITLEDLK